MLVRSLTPSITFSRLSRLSLSFSTFSQLPLSPTSHVFLSMSLFLNPLCSVSISVSHSLSLCLNYLSLVVTFSLFHSSNNHAPSFSITSTSISSSSSQLSLSLSDGPPFISRVQSKLFTKINKLFSFRFRFRVIGRPLFHLFYLFIDLIKCKAFAHLPIMEDFQFGGFKHPKIGK